MGSWVNLNLKIIICILPLEMTWVTWLCFTIQLVTVVGVLNSNKCCFFCWDAFLNKGLHSLNFDIWQIYHFIIIIITNVNIFNEVSGSSAETI